LRLIVDRDTAGLDLPLTRDGSDVQITVDAVGWSLFEFRTTRAISRIQGTLR
jgi:hypothetical protein